MTRTRSPIPGTVIERSPGVWQIRITEGYTPEGAQRRITRTVRGSRKAAHAERLRLLTEIGVPTVLDRGRTVGDIWNLWTKAKSGGWSSSTVVSHASIKRRLGDLMDVPADDLDAVAVEAAYTAMKVKPATVRRAHAALNACMRWALKKKLVRSIPMDAVDVPSVPRAEVATSAPAEVVKLLAWCAEHEPRWGLLWRLAFVTGARRGELVGLKWEDRMGSTLTIRRVVVACPGGQETRVGTKNGKDRVVALDAATQAAWESFGETSGYVFSETGRTPWNLSQVSKRYRTHQTEAKVTLGHLHALRHTSATQALQSGFSVRQVADRLGHDPAVLLRIYAASIPAVDQDLGDRLGRMLG